MEKNNYSSHRRTMRNKYNKHAYNRKKNNLNDETVSTFGLRSFVSAIAVATVFVMSQMNNDTTNKILNNLENAVFKNITDEIEFGTDNFEIKDVFSEFGLKAESISGKEISGTFRVDENILEEMRKKEGIYGKVQKKHYIPTVR